MGKYGKHQQQSKNENTAKKTNIFWQKVRMDKYLKRNNYKNLSYKTLIHRQKYLYDLYL